MAPARLHLGFLDLNGGLGRRFGSLGLTLDGIATRVTVKPSEILSAAGKQADRAGFHLERLHNHYRLQHAVRLAIDEAVPEHEGFGSGTQLALAIGMAVTRLYGIEVSPREIASLLDRGSRSGIGVAAFEAGGVLLDGGHGTDGAVPPLVARMDFPEEWRVILLQDQARKGLSGQAETKGMATLPPFPAEAAARLCRLVLMQAMPALALRDLQGFGSAVSELQRTMGDHFAGAQGGRFTSPLVADALAWAEEQGLVGLGQSSWGPTGFILAQSAPEAGRIIEALKSRDAALRLQSCRGRNLGGEVRPIVNQG